MDDSLFCSICIGKTIVLLLIANGAPIIAKKVLNDRYNLPLDLEKSFKDGHPLFGYSKTWRGLLSSVTATSLAAPLLNLSVQQGALFALATMCGDLLASFIKRRLGYIESSRTRGLDVLPESLLPALAMKLPLSLAWLDILAVAAIFFLIEVWLSPILYRWHIRNRPY
jgi:hypothetical protein